MSRLIPTSGSADTSPVGLGTRLLLIPLVALMFAAPAAAAVALDTGATKACGERRDVRCSEIDVPLNRADPSAGTVPLHVEVLPAKGTPRGAMFLIAGGPGQGSAYTFDLGLSDEADYYRSLFPGYTLVAYDDRGTGDSDVLDCPTLRVTPWWGEATPLVTACAESLGARRDFYGTGDHAEDLEAVRQAVGLDRIGLAGTSYGTKLALAYALAHPDHVERLLLDSVEPLDAPGAFNAETLHELPGTLSTLCSSGACRAATSDFAGDVVAVANSLAEKPLVGEVRQPDGSKRPARLDALDFLSLVVAGDLSEAVAAELPAVVHAARRGNQLPLLRLGALYRAAVSGGSARVFSVALFAATVCHDGPFPWAPDSPMEGRAGIVQAAVDALPAGSLGPFGSWAAAFGAASFCIGWPTPVGGTPLGAGPLPDVPMLALSGGFDMRTPTAGARSLVARFPQGHLLVVPGVGHSVLTTDTSGCATQAVHDWLAGGEVPSTCPRPRAYLKPFAAFPSVAALRSQPRASAEATLTLASQAVHEAEVTWLLASLSGSDKVAGLYGGKLVRAARRSFTLVRYSDAPGITLSGTIRLENFRAPLRFSGYFTVDGPKASRGVLSLSGDHLVGVLGSRRVGG